MGCSNTKHVPKRSPTMTRRIRMRVAKLVVQPTDPDNLARLLSGRGDRKNLCANAKHGLSMDMRHSVWPQLAHADELSRACPGLYELLAAQGPSPFNTVIVADVHRTLPYLSHFGTADEPGPAQEQLHRILSAYAHLDPSVGYCQGMNFLAGLLLVVGIPEHLAFLCLTSIMMRFGVSALFSPGLPMLQECTQLLNILLSRRSPNLFKHLQHHGAVASVFATPWIMSFFVSSPLPLPSAIVVLDLLLCEQPAAPLPPHVTATYMSLRRARSPRSARRLSALSSLSTSRPRLATPSSIHTPRRASAVATTPTTPLPQRAVTPAPRSRFSQLPLPLLRAALVLVEMQEEALRAADSLESVFRVLKGEDMDYHTAAFDNNCRASFLATFSTGHVSLGTAPSSSPTDGRTSRRGSIVSSAASHTVQDGSATGVRHMMNCMDAMDMSLNLASQLPTAKHTPTALSPPPLATDTPPSRPPLTQTPVCEYQEPVATRLGKARVTGSSRRVHDADIVAASPSMMATDTGHKYLLDGKVVHAWMLPKLFRALLNSPSFAIEDVTLEEAVVSTRRLSLAALQR